MKNYIFAPVAFLMLSMTAAVLGQIQGLNIADLQKMASGGIDAAMLQQLAAQQSGATEVTATTSKASPRLEKLKKLQFSRTPTDILKAWSGLAAPLPTKKPTLSGKAPRPVRAIRSAKSPQRAASKAIALPAKGATLKLPPGVTLPRGLKLPPGVKLPTTAAASPASAMSTEDFEPELALFQRNVTLGNWAAVKNYLVSLPEEEGNAGYLQMLTSLRGTGTASSNVFRMRDPEDEEELKAGAQNPFSQQMLMQNLQRQMARSGGLREQNVFSVGDVYGLALAAPKGLEKAHLPLLGEILKQAEQSGSVIDHFIAILKDELAKPARLRSITKRQAAQLLFHGDQTRLAGEFLPSLEEARARGDREGLNLLARHFLAVHEREKKTAQLENAWKATQAVLSLGETNVNPPFPPASYETAGITAAIGTSFTGIGPMFGTAAQMLGKSFSLVPPLPQPEKEEALRRAVELAKQVRKELGEAWLAQSFTSELQRGKEILATIGSVSAQSRQQHMSDADFRLHQLELQKTAVDAFLDAAPEKASQWKDILSVLAGNWLREAELTYKFAKDSSLAPTMQRDIYGNLFYLGPRMMQQQQQQQMVDAIMTGDVLENRPDERWLDLVEDGLKPKLATVYAQLFLKVSEEDEAFPYIESLSQTHTRKALALANEFLRVWTKNHDMNQEQRRTNQYMFMYGFEQRAQGIPLTRSKQERNLEDLAEWVKKLRGLNIGELDESLIADAFTACHSSAEVYRLEVLAKVFGPIDQIKPKTLAQLAQKMRSNLAGLWRDPALQRDKQTNRKKKDIQVEVQRGYALARMTVENCLKDFPNEWSLHLALAAIMHDENSYEQELTKSSEFSEKRAAAMAGFQRAAELYAARVSELSEDEETVDVYEQWFYAGLGACDLGALSEEKLPDPKQPALIRAAVQSLPDLTAERHMSKFANSLFTRMSAVKPASKFQYLESGFEIVGDHKQAREARQVFAYYKDLISEIKLETVVDGSDVVGHGQPFGVFVNIRHTREIERESGGFGRYLQNQNSSLYFSFNYGRPTADYRDKFETVVREAFQEHFEVLSVTFQSEKVHSRALPEFGWRVTPYAYILMKARGPQVDKIPSVHIDMDFMDTSGYVVIPIPSAEVPIDSAPEKPQSRPVKDLQITQILDERQSEDGKLLMEIKTVGLGLVPDLNQILDVESEGFQVSGTEDQGVSVSKFDEEGDDIAVLTERNWLVTLESEPNRVAPDSFTFATALVDPKEMIYQKYEDADLVVVNETIDLEAAYGKRNLALILAIVGGLAVVVIGAGIAIWNASRKRTPEEIGTWAVPENLTPFTVIGLLEKIHAGNHMSSSKTAELRQSILTVEQHYFSNSNGDSQVDLKKIAEHWVRQAN